MVSPIDSVLILAILATIIIVGAVLATFVYMKKKKSPPMKLDEVKLNRRHFRLPEILVRIRKKEQ
jgi:hypothetical protein